MAELELLRGQERADYDKVERLEVCTEKLVRDLQLEHDKVHPSISPLLVWCL